MINVTTVNIDEILFNKYMHIDLISSYRGIYIISGLYLNESSDGSLNTFQLQHGCECPQRLLLTVSDGKELNYRALTEFKEWVDVYSCKDLLLSIKFPGYKARLYEHDASFPNNKEYILVFEKI